MTKAKSTFEAIPILKKMLYGNNPHVLVLMGYGRYERHYYKINDKHELEVYGKSQLEEESLHNPIVKGKPTLDEDGRFLLKWEEGASFAYPINKEIEFQESGNVDLKIKKAFIVGTMHKSKDVKKGMFEDPIVLILVAVLFLLVVNLALLYFGFTSHGVDILGGQ